MSSKSKFLRPGALVFMKSGGPKMIVTSVVDYDQDPWSDTANCMYYNGTQFINQAFVHAVLISEDECVDFSVTQL